MATTYKTPGVYIEEIPKFPPSVAQVETAIPAFIGYTQKALRDGEPRFGKPTRISSLLEYVEIFGEAQKETALRVDVTIENEKETWKASFPDPEKASKHLMYYSLQLYFANGGGPCYIISIGTYGEDVGTTIPLTGYTDALLALEKEDEPTLIIFPEGQGMSESEYYGLIDLALQQCDKLKDRFVIIDIHRDGRLRELTNGQQDEAIKGFRARGLTNLKYGAAYFPNVLSIYNYQYDESRVMVVKNGTSTPIGDLTSTADIAQAKLALDSFPINLPPSAAVAGIYARVDNTRGVWKAPANEIVSSVEGLTFKVNDEQQKDMNVHAESGKSVNAIRAFVGQGIKIWGARTLAGNDNEWRYVNVRRFFNMVEESVKKATVQFVFEPNDANTWVRVKAMIENFLLLQWRAGALQGAKPEHAFYVSVGLGQTMTALDILEGRMIVEIGMAVVRPAEFIILRFSHKMAES
jgi:phage tail sheath protein FI